MTCARLDSRWCAAGNSSSMAATAHALSPGKLARCLPTPARQLQSPCKSRHGQRLLTACNDSSSGSSSTPISTSFADASNHLGPLQSSVSPDAIAAATTVPANYSSLQQPSSHAEATAAAAANKACMQQLLSGLWAGGAHRQEDRARAQMHLRNLKLQAAYLPSSVADVTDSLLLLVGMSAAGELQLPFLMEDGAWGLSLLTRLLAAQEMPIAVLAAEVLCRVCDGEVDQYAAVLVNLVPALLAVVRRHTPAPGSNSVVEGPALPLVFFTISALVRLTSSPRLARAIFEARGVSTLTCILTTQPTAICQVTTFALYRLVKAVDHADRSGGLPVQASSSNNSSNSSLKAATSLFGSNSFYTTMSATSAFPAAAPSIPAVEGAAAALAAAASLGAAETGPALPTPGLLYCGIKGSSRTRPAHLAADQEEDQADSDGATAAFRSAAAAAAAGPSSAARATGLLQSCSVSTAGDGLNAASEPGSASVIMSLARNGAFLKLLKVLEHLEGSAHELALALLLEMAPHRGVQQVLADTAQTISAAKLFLATDKRAVRLELVLVLARLSHHSTACQQDFVREGVVPALVEMMRRGDVQEQAHAARLIGLLGQHPSTHQKISAAGGLGAALALVRAENKFQHRRAEAARRRQESIRNAAMTAYNTAIEAGCSYEQAVQLAETAEKDAAATAELLVNEFAGRMSPMPSGAGDAAGVHARSESPLWRRSSEAPQQWPSQWYSSHELPADWSGVQSMDEASDSERQSGLGYELAYGSKGAAAGHRPGSPGARAQSPDSIAVSFTLDKAGAKAVLEQASSVACMLAHNPDNHFQMVSTGIVPELVPLLNKRYSERTHAYVLATMLMFCMVEPRHAAVVVRSGVIPRAVEAAEDEGVSSSVREIATALLAVLTRDMDTQVDIVASGGIPALCRVLDSGTAEARTHAAEALLQLSNSSPVRCRLAVAAGLVEGCTSMLTAEEPEVLMWGTRLLCSMAQDPTITPLLAESRELLKAVGQLLGAELHLSAQPGSPRNSSSSSSSSNDPAKPSVTYRSRGNAGSYSRFDPLTPHRSNTSHAAGQFGSRKPAGKPLPGVSVQRSSSGSWRSGDGSGDAFGLVGGAWQPSERQKQQAAHAVAATSLTAAQASAAWLLAKLCAGPRHQEFMSYCRAVVPSLVTLLRDAQLQRGGPSGYSLDEVLTGIDRSLHAATASALQAMSKMDVSLKHRILAELTLQLWLGYQVQLPGVSGAKAE